MQDKQDASDVKLQLIQGDLDERIAEVNRKSFERNPYQIIKEKETFYPDLSSHKYPRVLNTSNNFKKLMDLLKITIRYNLMTREPEIKLNEKEFLRDEALNASVNFITEIAELNEMPTSRIPQLMDSMAWNNPYHPVVEFIQNNPWDGVPRVTDFVDTIKTPNKKLSRIILITWLISAMAAAHSTDGFINQGVLVLQGPQGLGKTTWIKSLDLPGCNAIKESVFLDPRDKDSVFQLASHWISELGEIDSIFTKGQIGRIKSFVTTQFDHIRTPYAKKPTKLYRRSVYAGTVNDYAFLIDETGNRRWWTVEVLSIEQDHGIDIGQMWAEIYVLWKGGLPTYLSKSTQDALNEHNKKFEKIDPLKDKLLSSYDWTTTSRRQMSTTQILEELGKPNPSRAECTRLGTLLIEINKKPPKKTMYGNLHEVPPSIVKKIFLSTEEIF